MFTFENMVPVFTILGGVVGAALWLSSQLNAIKNLVYSQIEKTGTKMELIEKAIIEKLEYHERQDDIRFNEVHKDFWEFKIANASAVSAAKKLVDHENNKRRTNNNDD